MKTYNRIELESRESSQTNAKFYLILLTVFFTLSSIGIFNHEMWRDELEAWLIANNSYSLPELSNNLRYTGHPILWYACLYLITRFTDSVWAMQLFHIIIALSFVGLFLFYAPFSKLQKFLFCFGYFTLYEYTIISRNYGLGVLFLFAFCACYRYRARNYLPLAIILFLLSYTNAYCAIVGFALALTLIVDAYFNREQRRRLYRQRWTIVTSITIYAIGLITSLLQMIPPASADYRGDLIDLADKTLLYTTAEDINSPFFYLRKLAQSSATIWKAYVAIPDWSTWHFHSSNIFDLFTDSMAKVLGNITIYNGFNTLELLIYPLCIIIFTIVAISLFKKAIVLFFYLISNCALIGFYFFVRIPNTRHTGYLFIVFLVSLWLSNNYKDSSFLAKFQPRFFNKFIPKKSSILTFFLCLHLVGGVYAYSRDIVQPFSASKAAVEYIKENNYDRLPIVGTYYVKVAPFAALLNKQIYYPESEEFGTYTVWTAQRRKNNLNITQQAILEQTANLLNDENPEILLVLTEKLVDKIPALKIQPLNRFELSIIKGEVYYLYLVTKN